MSKAPAAWSLRYKSPADFPNIAKFGDDLDWNGAHKPLQMYFKEEELKDDDVVPIEKDSEYYRRKRERRRNYRKKNTLVLEDSAPPEESTGFRFEGKMCNLGLADIEDAKTKAAEVKEAPFRYVLLQFVKKENESGEQSSEINVIPVGDMFALKKASLVQDELLADVDERFIQEVQRNKGNINKYKGISKSLTAAERNRLGLRADDEHGEGRQAGLNAKEFLGGFGSSTLFGAAVNRAFGSEKASSRQSAGANSGSFLNENGMDIDELNAEVNENQGDYSTRFVDDEEEYVTVEQSRNQVMAELEISTSQRHSEFEADEEGHSDEDSENEDNGKDANLIEDEKGMVDHSMVTNAAEARNFFVTNKTTNKARPSLLAAPANVVNISTAGATAGGGSSTQPAGTVPVAVKSALKRGRKEAFGEEGTTAADSGEAVQAANNTTTARGVKFQDTDAPGASQTTSATSTAASATTTATATVSASPNTSTSAAVNTTTEYPLTEQGFRQFIRNRGGKVPTGDMNFFKPQLKACEKAVKKRFLDMVLNITVEVEDPLLGRVLTLK